MASGYVLGISAFYHDSAACLLAGDAIVAAAQEKRFARVKAEKGLRSTRRGTVWRKRG
jgi:predicted NodU family carbamoyl transferase